MVNATGLPASERDHANTGTGPAGPVRYTGLPPRPSGAV
jgi:hypothetical protein